MSGDDNQPATPNRGATGDGTSRPKPTAIPLFALNAVDRQSAKAAEIITTTADSIEHLVAASPVPLPDSATKFVQDAARRLRDLSQRANDGEAAQMLEGLQKAAAAHPVAAAGIGAAIGAALGVALSQLQHLHRGAASNPSSKD